VSCGNSHSFQSSNPVESTPLPPWGGQWKLLKIQTLGSGSAWYQKIELKIKHLRGGYPLRKGLKRRKSLLLNYDRLGWRNPTWWRGKYLSWDEWIRESRRVEGG